jgi:putative salt-induced outer membrane protein YdiY
MKRWIFLMAIIMVAAVEAGADVIHFKNGDRLTGKVERVQDDKLILKTQTVGEVSIALDKVESYASEGAAVVLVKAQKEVRGKLTLLPGGNWQVETTSGQQTVEAKNVEIIYPAKTYDEKGYGHHPKLWQSWNGKGSLGFSQVHGDQSSRTFSLNFNATRRLPVLPELAEHSRTNFFLSALFAKSEDTQGNQVSTNNVSSGIRQDFKITDKNFWFLLAQLDHSSTQSLDLRQTYGGGLGRDLMRRSRMELQALGGVTYVREHFQGAVYNQNAEALAGERFTWKMTQWLSLDHALSFYPNLTNGGNYRFDTMTGLSTKITRRWSFSTSYSDHYLSNPLPGHRKNEVIITTGVGVSF